MERVDEGPQRVGRDLPVLVVLAVLEVLDEHRGEQVEHHHGHEHHEAHEERVRGEAGDGVAGAVAHHPYPLVVGGDPEQRQDGSREGLEVGVLVERAAAAMSRRGAEQDHADVGVDEK